MNTPNPIQRFLGLVHASDSPFELLGMTPAACDAQAIRTALVRRLDRLAHHPEALSHEADEVRLALHVAAAQLLDPAVREKLASAASSSDGSVSTDHSSHISFQELAKRVLARAGGWGKESQRWLSLLAHAHGLSQSQLYDELRFIVEGAHSTPASSESRSVSTNTRNSVTRAPTHRTLYEEIHSPHRRAKPALSASAVWLIGSVMVLVVFAAAMTLRGALSRPAKPTESTQLNRALETTGDGASPVIIDQNATSSKDADKSGEGVNLRSPELVIRWLVLAQQELDDNPGEAAWRFERAVAALATTWTAFNDADRDRANAVVVSVLQRVALSSENGKRAFGAVTSPAQSALIRSVPATAESIRAAAWSVAMISMLASDPATVNQVRIEAGTTLRKISALTNLQTGSFKEHMLAAIPNIAQYLVGQTERRSVSVQDGWNAWVDIVERTTRPRDDLAAHEAGDRLILDAADRLLHSEAHPGAVPAARDAFELLLSRVSWSASAPKPAAWGALLRWFDGVDIETRDLAVATEWLVRQPISPRPEPNMVLSRNANLDGRSALRDRYARLWGKVLAADTLGFATVWSGAVRQTLVRFQRRAPADRLARAAVMSLLNEAAALRWRGDADGARAIILDPAAPIDAALVQSVVTAGTVRGADAGRDGQWAVRYLSSRRQDVETRSRLLVVLARHSGPLGPIDADVVVQTALGGASSELRTRAGHVVKRRASEAGVISAMLDRVSQAPKNRLTTALIAEVTGHRLPPPADDTWPAKVRLALIDRLLTLFGESDESSPIDRLSIVLARSYAVRAVMQQAESGADSFGSEQLAFNANSAKETLPDSYSLLWKSWRDQAQYLAHNRRAPVSFDAILRHHRGRLQLADGPMQQFAATQVSIAEAMALVVSAERPSRASDIELVIQNMAAKRREASTILDQIIAAESAMLQLWGIRFGLMLSEVDPTAVSLNTAGLVGDRS